MLKKAIKIIYSELSNVFVIEPNEVMPFILGRIDCIEK